LAVTSKGEAHGPIYQQIHKYKASSGGFQIRIGKGGKDGWEERQRSIIVHCHSSLLVIVVVDRGPYPDG